MMENLLKDFDVPSKNSSAEALFRWRSAVAIVKNPRRRFRMVADLVKRQEAEKKKRSVQEKLRVALFVQKAALQFIEAGGHPEYKLSKEAEQEGFGIDADELSSIVQGHDLRKLKFHNGVDGIAGKLLVGSDTGTTAGSLDSRHTIYGSNTFTETPYRSFLTFVWEALHDLTLIILIVCAGVSAGVGIATEGWPTGAYDGLGIALSVLIVVLVTAVSDYRQSLQFQELDREKKKISVQVTRDGRRGKVSIYELVVGDLVHLSIGDQVPADGLFVYGHSLLVDESSLSGEVDPVAVDENHPFLLSGTKVKDGSGKMMVTAVGMRTEWGKLMETLGEGGNDETPLQVKLNGVATVIGKIGLVFALLTFVVLAGRLVAGKAADHALTEWSSGDALELLNYFAIAVTIIVVAVPEGLPLAVTLSLAFAMKKLMDEMALVRQLSACETMGSATCICTDKTGTLTTNRMTVTRLTLSRIDTHLPYSSSPLNIEIPEPVLSLLLQAIFLNTGAEVASDPQGRRSVLGSPTESALLELALRLGGDPAAYRRDFTILKVEPFNSVRKKMATLVTLPGEARHVRAFCKGASEIVVGSCDKVVGPGGDVVDMTEEEATRMGRIIEGFASDSLRTLCLAYRDVEGAEESGIPEEGYTLIGVVGIKDPVRPGVKEAVSTCLRAGIVVRMVTGDNINTARAIAKECGILTEGGLAIEGKELRGKTDEQLREFIPRIQVVARSLPSDKHILVTKLRNLFGEVVAVTGDGTNDAPALQEADIGLAMGIAGTEVAKENADVIVLDDNFSTIVSVARWGRAVYINIQKFVQFQLTVNIVALIINFASACILGSAPLTAVQLLWVNMIMDTLGALALATEPPNEGLMRRKPVGKGVDFITPAMWRNIIGQAAYQLAVLGALTFSGENVLRLKGGSDATAVLNTFIFNTFVFCQLFNEINSRDIDKVYVFQGMFNSPIFITILISTALFQAVIIEILGPFSSTVPLGYRLWLLSIAIGSVTLPVGALLKLLPVGGARPPRHDGYMPLPAGPELA